MSRKLKILVTGGDGYIGTNLINRYSHVADFDICDYSNTSIPLAHQLRSVDLRKYQGIVHLAALSGIIACENNFIEGIEKNLLTANRTFSRAAATNTPVVFTSSQAAKDPLSSKYASFKAQCEGLAELYGATYVIRLSNVYGGDGYLEKKQTAVKQFIVKYNNGEPMEVHGDGNQKRDFIHVWDVCEAIMKVFAFLPADKSPMDIGTGIGTSIQDVVKMFPRKTNHHYKCVNGRSSGAESSIANINEADYRIHFKAKRKLEDYIKEMI